MTNQGYFSCFEVLRGHDAENFKLIGSSLQAYVTLSGISFLSPSFICFLGFFVSLCLTLCLLYSKAYRCPRAAIYLCFLLWFLCLLLPVFPPLLKSKPSYVSLFNKRKKDPEHVNEDRLCIHKSCEVFLEL